MRGSMSSWSLLLLVAGVVVASAQIRNPRERCPNTCPDTTRPVCGTDNKVYKNDCHLFRAACLTLSGLGKKHDGPCAQSGEPAPSRCREECTKIYLPLCGSDGVTYQNKCLLDLASCRRVEAGGSPIKIRYENACEPQEAARDVCQRNCGNLYEPVCGSDRITYHNKCELSIAICRNDQIRLQREAPCDGYEGTSGRRPSLDQRSDASPPVSSPVVTESCPDTCTGGFRPVCGSNNLTYGSDCYLELAQCRDPSLKKKADGVCTKDCSLQCDSARRLVCGTDGITYTNDCFLLLARCKDPAVERKHDGQCVFVEKPECRPRRCRNNGKSLCGSDGITYVNICRFNAAVCYNQGLLKLHDGPCKPDPRLCGRCEDNARKLVCGSDGRTYRNHCYLIRKACLSGKDITKVSNGPCRRQ